MFSLRVLREEGGLKPSLATFSPGSKLKLGRTVSKSFKASPHAKAGRQKLQEVNCDGNHGRSNAFPIIMSRLLCLTYKVKRDPILAMMGHTVKNYS